MPSLLIQGTSQCRQFTSGHKFTLERHFNANGAYVLTSVQHGCKKIATDRVSQAFAYSNSFTCIPLALPFRPPRVTAKPTVPGTQTAVVVGPPGEEIFTDKYGRVKVQFHWDREGKNNADSSCWIRVGQLWAGKKMGGKFLAADRPGSDRRLSGRRSRSADHRGQRLQCGPDAALPRRRSRFQAQEGQQGERSQVMLDARWRGL